MPSILIEPVEEGKPKTVTEVQNGKGSQFNTVHPDLEITKTKLILNRQELGISHPSRIPRRKNPVPLPRKPKTRGKSLQPQITL